MMSFASALALFTWFVAVTHAQNYTCGTVVLRSDSDMSLFLRIDEDISTMYITITGTAGEFFGVGFGVSVMTDNTYAIIVDDATGVFEQLLDDGSAGTKITQGDIYLQSDETVDGVRTVLVSRPIFGADYSFVGTYSSSLDLIWARKTGGIFGPHAQGTNFRDSTSISFLSGLAEDDASCGAAIPTDMSSRSTTVEPGSGPDEVTSDPVATMEDSSTMAIMEPTMPETGTAVSCGSVETEPVHGLSVSVRLDEASSTAYITMTGLNYGWFGHGFGASVMAGTYAIIADEEGVTEWVLGVDGNTVQRKINSTLTLIRDFSEDDDRTVLVSRPITIDDSDYYSFASSGDVPVIYANIPGTGTLFSTSGYHGGSDSQRGTATLSIAVANDTTQDSARCGADLTTTAAPDDTSTSSPTADANEDAAMSLAGLICVARKFVFICVLGALFVN